MEHRFMDLSLDFGERARELVRLLTVDEKISQMLHFSPAIPRLGIPSYTWWNEALHGVARAGTATVFPQSIGMAAAFDEDLVYETACIISDEVRAKHHEYLRQGDTGIYKGLTIWSPNINIFRDPRWGRGHETYGEDPYLTGRLGTAFIKGMQGGDDKYLKTIATAKHYAVHSGPEKLRHSFNAEVSAKDLYETYLPAFRDCVVEGGAWSVMGAYNRTNSEACCASPTLLQKILREEWGFCGYVVSDCHAICDLHLHHGLTDSPEESAAMAVKSGCDLNCGRTYASLRAAFEKGLISEDEIDTAVTRLFEARLRLGMFDPPGKVLYAQIPYSINDCGEHRAKAVAAAEKTIVLLRNDGVLPFSQDIRTIAVVGPNADDRGVLLANYNGIPSETVTVLEGIREMLPDARIMYSKGCHICATELREDETSLISEAVSCALAAEAVIIVTGLNSQIEGEEADPRYPEFGGGDRESLSLPGFQDRLIDALYETGRPLVMVNLSGSAVDLRNADKKCGAVVQAWYPGALGGRAVAQMLFGHFSPSGKLPVTFYESDEQLPPFEDYEMKDRTYRYPGASPLYPFGYGLGYSDFSINLFEAGKTTINAGESLEVVLEIENTGSFDARDIIQMYMKTPARSVSMPIHELKYFKPIYLKKGEKSKAALKISPAQMSQIDENGRRIVSPGKYIAYFGTCQPDPRSIQLTGKTPCMLEFMVESPGPLQLEY
ncbi:MAG: glycoside hydrolase family 3 C-terminal domain-containing protein [Clostridia bacterium]